MVRYQLQFPRERIRVLLRCCFRLAAFTCFRIVLLKLKSVCCLQWHAPCHYPWSGQVPDTPISGRFAYVTDYILVFVSAFATSVESLYPPALGYQQLPPFAFDWKCQEE